MHLSFKFFTYIENMLPFLVLVQAIIATRPRIDINASSFLIDFSLSWDNYVLVYFLQS